MFDAEHRDQHPAGEGGEGGAFGRAADRAPGRRIAAHRSTQGRPLILVQSCLLTRCWRVQAKLVTLLGQKNDVTKETQLLVRTALRGTLMLTVGCWFALILGEASARAGLPAGHLDLPAHRADQEHQRTHARPAGRESVPIGSQLPPPRCGSHSWDWWLSADPQQACVALFPR